MFINILFFLMLMLIFALLVIPDFIYQKQYDDKVLGMFNHFIVFLRGILLFIGLFKIQQGLRGIVSIGFYNTVNEKKFKSGGYFLILFGLSSAIFNSVIKNELQLNVFVTNFVQYFFVVLVGLGLYVFADFIRSAGVLKEENDLTI